MAKDLLLYVLPGCPYCAKVLNYMDVKGISIPVKSTAEPGAREELVRVGGKFQAPCLFIDGVALYESNDIIRFLATEFGA